MTSEPVIVKGVSFSALSAGIRRDGRVDVALAVCDAAATAAGVFTRNLVKAAPVEIAAQRLGAGQARAVLVNSGCANACTGAPGVSATLASTHALAVALGVDESLVLPASTGVIGAVLPSEKITAVIDELVGALSPSGSPAFAQAICTTDRWPKMHAVRLDEASDSPVVLGIAKGAGMIHPDLGLYAPATPPPGSPPAATMLAFLFTDAVAERAVLERALTRAVAGTFNACSVDGDTSTNDTVIAIATGAGRPAPSEAALERALSEVCDHLARSMVADGEGSEHCVELLVSGLDTDAGATQVARTVATSLLVKTALAGKDANWGRILAAAGRAGVPFEPSLARIAIGGIDVVRGGLGVGEQAERLAASALTSGAYRIELELGGGNGRARQYMCDLGHTYVDVNAGYRS